MTRERAVVFGSAGPLVGVWCEPEGGHAVAPALVMINSGVVHSAGAWRLHVRLARTLAAEGVPSLRFDLSGVGDSPPRAGASTLEEVVRQDLDDALDLVGRETGRRDAVLMGLCSGAADALDMARHDSDVRGIICIDLIGDFRNWQHQAVHYARRIARLESWKNTLTGRNRFFSRLFGAVRRGDAGGDDRPSGPAQLGLRPVLSQERLRRDLLALLDDQRRVLLVFTGGLERNYNHRSQFREVLPEVARRPELDFSYFGRSDHTFTDPDNQARLIDTIRGWLVR